jgi:hypothetical protein
MSYLPGIAIVLMVVSPVLVPLVITGGHLIAIWWRKYRPSPSTILLKLAPSPESA